MAVARTPFGSEMNAMTKTGFRRVALAASIGPTAAGLIFISESFAQNPLPPPAPGTAEVERVIVTAEAERTIVTGSNIPTSEEVGSNPVSILDRDLINKSGQGTTTEQLLKSLPIASANSIPVQNNATGCGRSAGGSFGVAAWFRSRRHTGSHRRPPCRPLSWELRLGGAAFFDLNTIPIAAVQSIEIQKDGASTTYGADAVAGVINLKFYKDYRGAQVTPVLWQHTG